MMEGPGRVLLPRIQLMFLCLKATQDQRKFSPWKARNPWQPFSWMMKVPEKSALKMKPQKQRRMAGATQAPGKATFRVLLQEPHKLLKRADGVGLLVWPISAH